MNKLIKSKKYPLSSIDNMIISIKKLTWATSLDLSMSFDDMTLHLGSRKYTVIILPWGMFEYTALPMGLKISTGIFQPTMSVLFQDMPEIFVYVDDIIIISSGSYEEHLKTVEKVIERLIRMECR